MKKYYLIITLLSTIVFIQCTHVHIKKEYYENGSLKSVAQYNKLDSIDGYLKLYYQSGNLESEQNFVNGKANGTFKWYYKDGKLSAQVNYIKGKEEGVYKSFYPSGDLYKRTDYKNGIIEGIYKEYYKGGRLKISEIRKGDDVVFLEEYDTTGKLIKDFRKIEIRADKDTINVNEKYKAIITLQGPKNGTFSYDASKLISKEALKSSKGYIEIKGQDLSVVNGSGLYESTPDKPGEYYYFGHAKIYSDSAKTIIRKYQFQKKVVVLAN